MVPDMELAMELVWEAMVRAMAQDMVLAVMELVHTDQD